MVDWITKAHVERVDKGNCMLEQRKNEYREYTYEWLRIISCISVVILHVSGMYLRPEFYDIAGYANYRRASWWSVLTCMCVPSFVMISGAFSLKTENANIGSFYKKTVKRIVFPTWIFSILYVLIRYMEIGMAHIMKINVGGDKLELIRPLKDWLKGQPNVTMWYMYMIIPLYFVTPLLVRMKQKVPTFFWRILAVIMLFAGFVLEKKCTLIWPIEFTEYLGYFLAGDIIRELSSPWKKKKEKCAKYIGILCIITSYAGLVLYGYHAVKTTGILEMPQYLSLIVITMSLLQFIGFSFLKIDVFYKWAQLISKYSLDIYLLHPMFLIVATQYFCRIKRWLPSTFGIPAYSGAVIGLCLIVLIVFQKVMIKIKEKGGTAKC